MDEDKKVDAPQQQALDQLLTVESAIKQRISAIEKLKADIQPHKEMLSSYLDNDPAYRETVAVAKKATQQKSAIKKQLLSIPEGKNLVDKINTMKEEMRELDEGLSYYLREYQRITGASEFEGEDGELRQIVFVAKLIRKTNLNK